jgi:hypothetical protein
MILKNQYIENNSISSTEYKDEDNSRIYYTKPGYAIIYRKAYPAGTLAIKNEEIKIDCTKEEYEIAIMYLERDMNK